MNNVISQMVFLFAMLWGMCSTVMGAPARKSFSEFFRNLVDGLLKGHAKPASFKLVRTNLMNVRNGQITYQFCWVNYSRRVKSQSKHELFFRIQDQFSIILLIQRSLDYGVLGPINHQMSKYQQLVMKMVH